MGHDALWNICPTFREVNSSKSDALPNLDRYLQKFLDTQYHAMKSVLAVAGDRGLLFEDYSLIFKVDSVTDLTRISEPEFKRLLEGELRPQHLIAQNCGFQPGWIYS